MLLEPCTNSTRRRKVNCGWVSSLTFEDKYFDPPNLTSRLFSFIQTRLEERFLEDRMLFLTEVFGNQDMTGSVKTDHLSALRDR
jgi:hypothetical protein